MNKLTNQTLFSFKYGGVSFSEINFKTEENQDNGRLIKVHTLEDGFSFTNIITFHGDAIEWVNYLENNGNQPTEIISELNDADISLPLPHEDPRPFTAFYPEFEDCSIVEAPIGSTGTFDEFSAHEERLHEGSFVGNLPTNSKKTYAPTGGRSSDERAPFFCIRKGNMGYFLAVGWTGQWNLTLERREDNVLVKSGIEDLNFRLLPGEKIRTSSFVVMPYEGNSEQGHNKWRRLLKTDFSLIGKEGRDAHGPLCAAVWGGLKTETVLKRIEIIKENKLPFDYIWMDAGWYGIDTKATPDEFEGDWPMHTGDWRVSPNIHPQGLKDVSAAAHEAGFKFLLWVEPERVIPTTPIAKEHPEYFIILPYERDYHLNLGREDAWNYCFNTLSGLIESIGIDCYRQDFNFRTLNYWRSIDTEDRRGITEIKHICGLYRLWDALLKKFPNLIIDNCASGGRRIDIETLRRSIPLWRTDYTCPANFPAVGPQCHSLGFSKWMPYSGTGTGRLYDTYRARSTYAPALNTVYSFTEREHFGEDPKDLLWLKNMLNEYLRVRPYTTEDFYQLTELSDNLDVWCAYQYHDPKTSEGVIQVFRRERAPYKTAYLPMKAVDPSAEYVFTDSDDNSEFTVSGSTIISEGLALTINKKRTAKVFFYKKK